MPKSYLEPDDIEQLENVAMNLRDKLLVRMLFHLGCRVSEVLGLEVKEKQVIYSLNKGYYIDILSPLI